jgi:hypothetical protein
VAISLALTVGGNHCRQTMGGVARLSILNHTSPIPVWQASHALMSDEDVGINSARRVGGSARTPQEPENCALDRKSAR